MYYISLRAPYSIPHTKHHSTAVTRCHCPDTAYSILGQPQLATTLAKATDSERSTLLRLGNHRSIGSALFHKKLETTARSSHLLEIFGRLAKKTACQLPIFIEDWRAMSAAFFPSFPLPSRLAVNRTRGKISSHVLGSCSSFPSLGFD